jgi:uncharacterized protein (DUF697 family)
VSPRTRTVVRATEIGAAVVAAVLSPVPLADEIVLAPALLGLAAVIGRDQGVALGDLPWRALAQTAAAGLAARATLNLAVAAIPGVAAVANALTAYALTRAYADWAVVATRPAPEGAGAAAAAGNDGVVTQAS